MQEGYIVIHFTQTPLPDSPTTLSTLSQRIAQRLQPKHPMVSEAEVEQFSTDAWFHIGLHYWKPYRPTFRALTQVGTDHDHVKLQQTGRFFNEFELFSLFPLQCQWSVQFYRIVSTAAPVAPLQPSCCWVEALSAEPQVCWTGGVKRRYSRRQPPHGSGSSKKKSSSGTLGGQVADTQAEETQPPLPAQNDEALHSPSGSEAADEAEVPEEDGEESEGGFEGAVMEEQLQEVFDVLHAGHGNEEQLLDASLLETLLPPPER